MAILRTACSSCGAALDVPADAQRVKCEYCGSTFQVERSAGQATLIAATEIGRAVHDSGAAMQADLKRLQLNQELSAARMMLMQLQAEIRGLERGKLDKRGKRQLSDLRRQERDLQQQIAALQVTLNPPTQGTAARQATRDPGKKEGLIKLLFGWKIDVSMGGRRWAIPVGFTGLLLCCFLSVPMSLLNRSSTPTPAATQRPAATQTPAATQRPAATQTPAAKASVPAEPSGVVGADAVIAAFKAAGLEASDARLMTKDDYGRAPLVGKGVRFFTPSLCSDCGGRVIVVEDAAERARLKGYYKVFGRLSTLLFTWVFEHGALVVQLSGDMPEEQARKYEAALKGLP